MDARLDAAAAIGTALPVEGWSSSLWRRLAQIGAGHALYAVFNWLFDNVLYVYVIYTWGMVKGGAFMTALSLLQCAATLVIYQRMRIDWVGAGLIRDLKRNANRSRGGDLLVWASQRSPCLIFVLLCILQDAFITTAYFKEGRFTALTRRDWQIFLGAVLFSNLYWIVIADLLGKAVMAIWSYTTGLI